VDINRTATSNIVCVCVFLFFTHENKRFLALHKLNHVFLIAVNNCSSMFVDNLSQGIDLWEQINSNKLHWRRHGMRTD
jgi:hypothetical protein